MDKEKIKKIVEENMDDLEDEVTFALRELLKRHGLAENRDLDAISYARKVFYSQSD